MPIYKLARFEVRPEAAVEAERAMHEYATFVRADLPGWSWTTYRDVHAPHRFTSMARADTLDAEQRQRDAAGTRRFLDALAPILVGEIETTEWQLVTSSDLAPRPRARDRHRR